MITTGVHQLIPSVHGLSVAVYIRSPNNLSTTQMRNLFNTV